MEGFFTLNTASDLRDKLRRDLAKLRATPTDIDLAFNFFVTAEAMRDWVHPGLKSPGRDARQELLKESTTLQVCSHLANGGKHFKPEAKQNRSVEGTKADLRGGRLGSSRMGTSRLAAVTTTLVVDLQGDAAAELGPTIEAVALAERVMAYWDAHPLT